MRRSACALLLLLAACDGPIALPWTNGDRGLALRAASEGRLVIWSTTDRPAVDSLLSDFRVKHPGIRIEYRDISGKPMHELVRRAADSGHATADLLWASSMDLQIKLVNDGFALKYDSPERPGLPKWANWKNEAWGVTAEPIVMVYNRALLPAELAPRSHGDLLRVLEARSPSLRNRIATYDVENSAVGYLYLSQDVATSRLAWPLVRALGANGVRRFSTSEQIIADVSAGRSVIGYNVVGSYAAAEARRNPNLRVVLPSDYTLLMSRIAVIPAGAPHPNAAKLFLDYLLSRRGQRHLVAASMPAVRTDLPSPDALRPPEQVQRAIRVGPALLVVQDRLTRKRLLSEWRRLTRGGQVPTKGPRLPLSP